MKVCSSVTFANSEKPKTDPTALFKLSYGLFVLTAKDGEKENGCIINTAFQGANEPTKIAISCQKGNLTREIIERTGKFNVSVLTDSVPFETIRHFGMQSGRDVDKFKELGLTPEAPEVISVPGIKELPLTLECKVVYKQQQYPECMTDPEPPTHYPENSQDIHADYHTAYYGQIVAAYMIE